MRNCGEILKRKTMKNSTEIKTPKLNDAHEMHRMHPDTFEVPGVQDILELKNNVLTHAKVSVGDERFWVKVITYRDDTFIGTVDNDLIMADKHGLNYGDTIEFGVKHVYGVC